MTRAVLIIILLFATSSSWACKVAFPNELVCESGERVALSPHRLMALKKSLDFFYNKRDGYIEQQENKLNKKKPAKVSKSSCFNLRHSEMYANFLIQVRQKNSSACADHVNFFVKSVEQLINFKSEENQFITNHKHKMILLDQSVEIISQLEALKMETLRL